MIPYYLVLFLPDDELGISGVVELISGSTQLSFSTAGDLRGEGALIGLAAFAFTVSGHGSITVSGPPVVEMIDVFTPGLEACGVG